MMRSRWIVDKRWAQARAPREQLVLYPQMLDESISSEHPIRILDALLKELDWTDWEARYNGHRGQPPIHPRLVAGAVLYGMIRGVSSSRQLEDATRERVDFMWFLEGRTIDHATFAAFRMRFKTEIKQLNRQLAVGICKRLDSPLAVIALDGTRIRANCDRHGARTAGGLEKLIGACQKLLDEKLELLTQADAEADANRQVEERQEEIQSLRAKASQLEKELKNYHIALEVAQQRDARKQKMDGKRARATRVSVSDPDAHILPNKEGGYAPNYTPVAAADLASGAIIYQEVPEGADEGACVLPAVRQAQELATGDKACSLLADGAVVDGKTLHQLESEGIPVYTPVETEALPGNPAQRPDPTQAIPCEQRDKLPLRNNKLARAAFIYDGKANCYYCPMGRILRKVGEDTHYRNGAHRCRYKCPGKVGCPLADKCVAEKTAARTIMRDEYQGARQATGERMTTPEGIALYKQRAPAIEGVFARIKQHMRFRSFHYRGLEKVRGEWSWVCCAYNLKLLLRIVTPKPRITRKRAQNALHAAHRCLQNALQNLHALLRHDFPTKTTERPWSYISSYATHNPSWSY